MQFHILAEFAAILEVATGLALIAVPSIVARLLFGPDLSGVGLAIARLAGIALCALGLSWWPGKETGRSLLWSMLTYNLLIAIYLTSLGVGGGWVGPLLWPAVVLHAVLTSVLARCCWVAKNSIRSHTSSP